MKLRHLLLLAGALSLSIVSCQNNNNDDDPTPPDDEKKTCGEESIAVSDLQSFGEIATIAQFNTDEAVHEAAYGVDSGMAQVALSMTLTKICSSDSPFITVTAQLYQIDSDIVVVPTYEEVNGIGIEELDDVWSNNFTYSTAQVREHLISGDDPTWVILTESVFFPTQGSRAADSVYFESHVVKLELSAGYSLPK